MKGEIDMGVYRDINAVLLMKHAALTYPLFLEWFAILDTWAPHLYTKILVTSIIIAITSR